MTKGAFPRLPTATGFAAGHAVARLRARDIDPAPLLDRLGLSERDFNKGQIRVSADAQARLLEAAARGPARIRPSAFTLPKGSIPEKWGCSSMSPPRARIGEALAALCPLLPDRERSHSPPTETTGG